MSDRPNVLIMLTDQQRFDTICAAGFDHMKTPNMDRLVKEGCLFTNAYSPNPICVPARHYLLTGAPGRSHGYFDNGGYAIKDNALPTIARVFSENGYYTAAVGKCHFHPPCEHHGYNELHLMEELPRHISEDAYLQYLKDNGYGHLRNIHGIRTAIYHEPQAALVEEEHVGCNWVAKRAIEWIDQNQDRPFYLTCNWIKPHPPWNIPEGKEDLYRDVDLPEAIERSRERPFPPHENPQYGDGDTPEQKRRIRQAYYTTISMVDEAVGQVLDGLEERNLLDNTMIIFTSDHGEMLQDKGFYQKMLPYESSARVPFIIRSPKHFEAGSRVDAFVDLMDIFPTCIDAAGIDYHYKEANKDYQLFGGSLLPDSQSPWKREREYQFCDSLLGRYRWVMLRDQKYKYVYFFAGGKEQLFDMENDFQELHNLIGTDACPQAELERLRAKCVEYELAYGPGDTVKDGAFIARDYAYEDFDWNNCDKYPRWGYAHFQHFGHTDAEDKLFLDELSAATARSPQGMLARVPMPEEGKRMMGEGFEKLGGDPKELFEKFQK